MTNSADVHTSSRRHFDLGVRGLPAFAGCMNSGGVYVLATETPPARMPLLAGALASASASGEIATLIIASKPEQFLKKLAENGLPDVMERIETGRLCVFLQQADFNKKMFRHGAAVLVAELRHFGLPDGGLVVFDHADELLSLHDLSLALEQIEALHRWAEETHSTLLLSFTVLSTSPHSLNTLMALADHLAGIARLDAGAAGLELIFDYWQSLHGSIAARNYRVLSDGRGYAMVSNTPTTAVTPSEKNVEAPADTEKRYFYLDRALAVLESSLPGNWQYRDSLIGLLQACQGSRTPSVLLTFSADTSLRELAQTVHTLRVSIGRGAKILIFEQNASLRYANEALLLSLGASLIVQRATPSGRWALAVQSAEGQMFDRDLNIDFDTALSSVSVTPLRGYLQPLQFAQEVMMILERAAVLNVPGAMVVARAERDLVLADILADCRLSRAGDLVTCDGEHAYFFFAGCPASNLRMTLERALGIAAGSVLAETRSLTSRPELMAELAELGKLARAQPMPDLREQLADVSATREAVKAEVSGHASLPLTRAGRTHTAQPVGRVETKATPAEDYQPMDLQRFRYGGRLARSAAGKSHTAVLRAHRPNTAPPAADAGADADADT